MNWMIFKSLIPVALVPRLCRPYWLGSLNERLYPLVFRSVSAAAGEIIVGLDSAPAILFLSTILNISMRYCVGFLGRTLA